MHFQKLKNTEFENSYTNIDDIENAEIAFFFDCNIVVDEGKISVDYINKETYDVEIDICLEDMFENNEEAKDWFFTEVIERGDDFDDLNDFIMFLRSKGFENSM